MRAPGSPLALSLLLAGLLVDRAALALPLPWIAESRACRVSVSKVSYDDPDADDAEFLEFRVERTSGDAGAVPEHACSTSDAAQSPSPLEAGIGAPQTLADCGLSTLELVNGGSGACEKYRSLAVGTLSVPDDGYVVLCAVDSTLATAGLCDATAVGTSTLKNGWLQNGPNDGLRFLGPAGEPLVELGCEGGPACFVGATLLPEESGKLPGATGPEDDVAALCGAEYRLLPASEAPLRSEPGCASGAMDSGVSGNAIPPDASPWLPEYVPPGTGGSSWVSSSAATGTGGLSVSHGSVPSAPSCSAAVGRHPGSAWPALLGLAVGVTLRTRRPCPGSRARSRARYGSSRPRLPSR